MKPIVQDSEALQYQRIWRELKRLSDANAAFNVLHEELPTGAQDGQRICYSHPTLMQPVGTVWELLYVASNNRWSVLGGNPLRATGSATQSTTATTAAAGALLTTPDLVIPLKGDYAVEIYAEVFNNVAGSAAVVGVSYDPGTGAVRTEVPRAVGWSPGGANVVSAAMKFEPLTLDALSHLQMFLRQQAGGGGTAGVNQRWIGALPKWIYPV
jgi:hypothetical protein